MVIRSIEDKIGVRFNNSDLLKRALTHPSFSKESNERLEFLGDSILGFTVSKILYLSYDFDEGILTTRRSQLVCTETLASAARNLKLDKFMFAERSGVLSDSVLAGCYEALIGAIYLDQGLEKVEDFIKRSILLAEHKLEKNWKGILQEYTIKHKGLYPHYELVNEEGPPHRRRFDVEIKLGNETWGWGSGRSIQSAEKEAAKMAVEKFCREDL